MPFDIIYVNADEILVGGEAIEEMVVVLRYRRSMMLGPQAMTFTLFTTRKLI
jgi:hypothetical protein